MPDWRALIAARLSLLSLRPEREREIVDELSQHLGDRYQELRTGGASEEEAVRLAIDEIDDEDLLVTGMRALRQASVPPAIAPGVPERRWFGDVRQDLGYAARMLRKNPGFGAAIVITLALGIGANTAIFSLINATLLRKLPIENRDRLFAVMRDDRQTTVSYPAYRTLRDGLGLAERFEAWANITASLNADGETGLVSGAIVTGNYFDTLGVRPARGRLLAPADDVTPGGHAVVVVSDRLWRGRFGGRDDIAGHAVRLNGQPFTVVGVTPPDFPGVESGVWQDIFVPMMMQAWMRPPRGGYSGEMNPDLLKNPNNGWLATFVRVKPGVSGAQAHAEMEPAFVATLPPGAAPTRGERAIALYPLDEGEPRFRRLATSAAWLLAAVVGAVLLIACANVANLLLSKASSRRREVAIRLALGASRRRIIRQLLTESVLLALIGGGVGVALAVVVLQLFYIVPPPAGALPIELTPSLDRGVLLFSLLLSTITGIAFGVAPAWQTSRPELVRALKDDGFVLDRRARRFNLKTGLVVAEVALAVILLVAAGLFVRSLRAIQSVDSGMAVAELVTAPLNINLLRYTRAQGREFYQQLVDRLEQVPGVASAAVSRTTLLTGGGRITGVHVEGRPQPPPQWTLGENASYANIVGPGYFETMGVAFVAGRDFSAADLEDHPLVVIVNETLARQFFPGDNAIGKRVATGFRNASGEWAEIVGIVRDSKYARLSERPMPIAYMPLSQRHETGMTLYVRSAMPAGSLVSQVRREIQQLEPDLPVPAIETMSESISTQLFAQRMGANLLAGFGGLALLLASLGVYGVLAFSISQRRHELGVRMAVGADRRTIFSLVIREGLALVAAGLAIGLASSAALTRLVASLLFGTSALDAVTFAAVPAMLVVVALVACYLPARRATRVDPVVALRNG
jgi:putative ABC transport system permease protein